MCKFTRFIHTVLFVTAFMFSPLGRADESGPRTGLTASYFTGTSGLLDVDGFNTPASHGYQIGFQGRSLGITYGQSRLGGFKTTTSGTFTNNVDVDSNEVLLNYRIYSGGASLLLFYGISNWTFINTTQLSQNSTSGSSPVGGVGLKLGSDLGLLVTAMYYKSITDSDIITFNAGG
jgi:hypothetical protein